MGGTWKQVTTENRVDQSLENLGEITIKTLTKDKSFNKLSIREAYKVDGVHMYVELTNASELLNSTTSESTRCHQRYIRFLNLYQRAIYEVLKATELTKIDFQNHRLHTVVYKPYNKQDEEEDDSSRERQRIIHTIGIASLIKQLLKEANARHDEIEDVEVAIGIESGMTLAVQNGTRGDREPLFLGPAANNAAKILKGKTSGVFVGERVQDVLGLGSGKLTTKELEDYEEEANLDTSLESLLSTWDNSITKLDDINFTRPSPPLKNLNFDNLTPRNSKRFEGLSVFADIDGFSKFVANRMENDDEAKEVVKVLHVLRKELRDVLFDFDGRKVRYHGDCIQGVMMEGSTQNTYDADSIDATIQCAGAMRSAFDTACKILDVDLGLAIGIAYGPLVLTRLGIKRQRDRCALGRCIFESEELQRKCSGVQTYVNDSLVSKASDGIKAIFEDDHRVSNLDYNTVCAHLNAAKEEEKQDSTSTAKRIAAAISTSTPIIRRPFTNES